MNFFDRIRKRAGSETKASKLTAAFLFRGNTYLLDEFDIDFQHDSDGNRYASGDNHGCLIIVTTSDILGDRPISWMMNLHETRDGEIRLVPNVNKLEEGTILYISFKDAHCISYQKVMHPSGVGVQTTLVISPGSVKIGNEEFENVRK
jgi:hypothetical protein